MSKNTFLLAIAAIITSCLLSVYGTTTGGGDDGFFFFSSAGAGFNPDAVARVMTSRMQNLFGKEMKVEPFIEKKCEASCDKDLTCTFTNATCCWHNVRNDAGSSILKDVYVASGKPNDTGMAIFKNFLFGTDELPEGKYGIIPTQQVNVSKVQFCSSPLPFRKPSGGNSEGTLSVKHWAMARSFLSACVRIYDPANRANEDKGRKWPKNWLGCSSEVGYGENTFSKLTINMENSYTSLENLAAKHGKSKAELVNVQYEVCLLMGPFPMKQGGLLLIDQIEWEAGSCQN